MTPHRKDDFDLDDIDDVSVPVVTGSHIELLGCLNSVVVNMYRVGGKCMIFIFCCIIIGSYNIPFIH